MKKEESAKRFVFYKKTLSFVLLSLAFFAILDVVENDIDTPQTIKDLTEREILCIILS